MKEKNGTYHGTYEVINKNKYAGNHNPEFRRSWKRRLCHFFDENDNVIKWSFEPFSIPYLYEIDGKIHKYIIDFYAEIKDNMGNIKKYIIEVKPKKQTSQPKPPKNNNQKAQKRYMYEMTTFIKNKNKWNSAIEFCNKKGLIFKLITEDTLF